MISVYGTPIIENQIFELRKIGGTDFVNAGYEGDKSAYLIEKNLNIEILIINKFELNNNLYSLFLAVDMQEDSFILYGDVYIRDSCLPIIKTFYKE